MAKFTIRLVFIAMLSLRYSGSILLSDDQQKVQHINSESEFSVQLFKATYASHSLENIIFSPIAVYLSLIFAYLAASGETKELIASKLHLEWANCNDDEVYAAYFSSTSSRRVNNPQGLQFVVSNHFYASEGIAVE